MLNEQTVLENLKNVFPFPSIRKEQQLALENLAPWLLKSLETTDKKKVSFFGCDAPTGIGKTALAVSVAKAFINLKGKLGAANEEVIEEIDDDEIVKDKSIQVWIVTQNKILQDQYSQDFPELYDLRGLDNYACYHDPGQTCGTSKCARLKKKKGQDKERPPAFCGRACEYDERMRGARREPILLLNVAKALTLLKSSSNYPDLLIFDEGHNVEASLDNEAALTITPKELEKIQYRFEKYFKNLKETSFEDLCEELKVLKKDLGKDYDKEASQAEATRDAAKIKKLDSLIKKIETVLRNKALGIDYISCNAEFLDLRPLRVYEIFRDFFTFPILFLSATLLSKRGFCSITGLKDEELSWLSLESPFPKENRKLINYWRLGARPINFNNKKEEEINLLNRIRDILKLHPNERGIIHTHTYETANILYEKLGAEFMDRFLYPKTAAEQKDILEKHSNLKNSILISPSMTEGVDLKGDLCRFSIMCKVPYMPLKDPVVEARMATDTEWYNYRTAMTIVQAPGRGVRSATDYCTTYLVDPGFQGFFNRARQHFPNWFLDAWDKRPRGSY